jgi:chemotaxis protein methyltransferase CheR
MEAHVFQALAVFLKENSGLSLTPDKSYLLKSRLQPVAEGHGCGTVAELVRKLQSAPTLALKQDITEAMTTNETSFFRDTTPFETFRTHVIPTLLERRKARRSIRILCAAASSGQEPYSLALILAEMAAALAGWNTEIIGVDLDSKILKRAEAGLYSQFEVQRGLPVTLLMKYFEQLPDQMWRIKSSIRDRVQYRQCNLLRPFQDLGQFDVIFCRNVLIYFDLPTKKGVLERLADRLATDGFLFLGGAETVLDITDRLVPTPQYRGMYLPQAAARSAAAAVA